MTKVSKKSNSLDRLQDWYSSQCNGDWEHQFGVKIDTLDNPGWDVEIDIRDTDLVRKEFKKISIQRKEENNWIQCWVNDEKFIGSCGPKNLVELLGVFLDWTTEC